MGYGSKLLTYQDEHKILSLDMTKVRVTSNFSSHLPNGGHGCESRLSRSGNSHGLSLGQRFKLPGLDMASLRLVIRKMICFKACDDGMLHQYLRYSST